MRFKGSYGFACEEFFVAQMESVISLLRLERLHFKK
jgi:hypothetical protein